MLHSECTSDIEPVNSIDTNGIVFYFVGCSEHSDMLENQQNHPKMCHRGDGQCTCYYCTIFGHTVRKMVSSIEL